MNFATTDTNDVEGSIELKITLNEAMEALTVRQRAIIRLYYLYDFTQEELAGVFGNVPNTVGRQRRVALDILRGVLEQGGECLGV